MGDATPATTTPKRPVKKGKTMNTEGLRQPAGNEEYLFDEDRQRVYIVGTTSNGKKYKINVTPDPQYTRKRR